MVTWKGVYGHVIIIIILITNVSNVNSNQKIYVHRVLWVIILHNRNIVRTFCSVLRGKVINLHNILKPSSSCTLKKWLCCPCGSHGLIEKVIVMIDTSPLKNLLRKRRDGILRRRDPYQGLQKVNKTVTQTDVIISAWNSIIK